MFRGWVDDIVGVGVHLNSSNVEVAGIISTHLQSRAQIFLKYLVNVTTTSCLREYWEV